MNFQWTLDMKYFLCSRRPVNNKIAFTVWFWKTWKYLIPDILRGKVAQPPNPETSMQKPSAERISACKNSTRRSEGNSRASQSFSFPGFELACLPFTRVKKWSEEMLSSWLQVKRKQTATAFRFLWCQGFPKPQAPSAGETFSFLLGEWVVLGGTCGGVCHPDGLPSAAARAYVTGCLGKGVLKATTLLFPPGCVVLWCKSSWIIFCGYQKWPLVLLLASSSLKSEAFLSINYYRFSLGDSICFEHQILVSNRKLILWQ